MRTVLAAPAPPPSRARLRTGNLVPAPPHAQPGVERDKEGLLWLLPTHQDSPPTGYYASSMHDVRLSDGAMRLLPIEQPPTGASVFGGGSDVEDEEEDVYRYARQHAEQVALEQQEQAREQRRSHEVSYRRRRALWWVTGGSLAVVALLATPPAQNALESAYANVVEVEKEKSFTVPAELLD